MTENVVPFTGLTRINTPPEEILEGAVEADLEEVVVVGFRQDGSFFFASSQADGGDTLWLLAMAQKMLLDIAVTPASAPG